MQDPPRAAHQTAATLVCALVSQVANVVIAALLAGQMGASYRARAWSFLGALLWSVAGTIVLFIRTGGAAPAGASAVSVPRVALWTVSAWVWPVLLRLRPIARPKTADPPP